MKENRKRLLLISILIACSIFIIGCTSSSKEEKFIKDFLICWFEMSESNNDLYERMMGNATVIGAGVETTPAEAAEQYAKNIKEINDAFNEVYGSYLTEEAMAEFSSEQFMICRGMFEEDDEWEISDVIINKDGEEYKFEVQITVNSETDESYLIQGRVEVKDGKINKIKGVTPTVSKK